VTLLQQLRILTSARSGICGVAVATMLFVVPAFSQRTSPNQITELGVAQRFLGALYPELKDKKYIMTIIASSPFDSDLSHFPPFGVSVGPTEQMLRSTAEAELRSNRYWEKSEVLRASFQFRKGTELIDNVYIEFTPLKAKSKLLLDRVDSHQQWSEQQITASMKKAGAKFGPDDQGALLKEVPTEALEPFIGEFRIESSEFHLRHEQSPRSLAELYWEVNGESELPGGLKAHWTLNIEPFAGRLTSLSRYPNDR
jgi:hypothetical protein